MSNLVPYGNSGSGLVPGSGSGLSRRSPIGRELSRVQGQAMVRALQTDIETRLADMKIDAVTSLGSSAQQHIAAMTAMEGELMKAVPLAAGRLEMIGNLTAIATTEIITDAVTKFRRI
ncbi:MAG: hypothetical protein FWH11_10655 [Micrococcales bacterium]|nr:hypothetical protein [Micrococcales bacterium]